MKEITLNQSSSAVQFENAPLRNINIYIFKIKEMLGNWRFRKITEKFGFAINVICIEARIEREEIA